MCGFKATAPVVDAVAECFIAANDFGSHHVTLEPLQHELRVFSAIARMIDVFIIE